LKINNGEDDFGDFFDFTYIDSFGVIRIVDGQTRLRGAEEAYKTARTEKDFNLADDTANTRVQITLTFL